MGSCVSRSTAAAARSERRVATAKVMDLDGSMAQFAAPVTAGEALKGDDESRRSASCFVCSSDELRFDAPARALAAEEPLQAGQLYFVLPLSMLGVPLSGQDMAALAVKASSALADVAGASSWRKNGKQRKAARVGPLVVASSSTTTTGEGERDGERNQHVYGKYGTRNTAAHGGDETVGKARRKGAHGYRTGTRRGAGVQTLSAISEASDSE